MARDFDIRMIGDQELIQRFLNLETKTQRKVLGPALRRHAKVVKERIIANVPVDTGLLRDAFRKTKIRSASGRRRIRVGVTWPTPESLGIAPDSKYYYPKHVEYGHGLFGTSVHVQARPYLRPAIDHHVKEDTRTLARFVGEGIEKQWAKGNR